MHTLQRSKYDSEAGFPHVADNMTSRQTMDPRQMQALDEHLIALTQRCNGDLEKVGCKSLSE